MTFVAIADNVAKI